MVDILKSVEPYSISCKPFITLNVAGIKACFGNTL